MINLSIFENVTTAVGLVRLIDNESNGLFGGMIILCIMLVLIFSLKTQEFSSVMVVVGFTGMILSMFFYGAGIVHFLWIIGFLIVMIISLGYKIINSK